VVAFEASAATQGESCRDVVGRLVELHGMSLDDPALLRTTMGGAAGCSHLLAVAQLLCATLTDAVPEASTAAQRRTRQLLRRDLIFDGNEQDDGRLAIAIQLSDLHTAPAPAGARAMARFRRHDELRLSLLLDGWPATIAAARGAERSRDEETFATPPGAISTPRSNRCGACRSARARHRHWSARWAGIRACATRCSNSVGPSSSAAPRFPTSGSTSPRPPAIPA
jgi:hypothetical protein